MKRLGLICALGIGIVGAATATAADRTYDLKLLTYEVTTDWHVVEAEGEQYTDVDIYVRSDDPDAQDLSNLTVQPRTLTTDAFFYRDLLDFNGVYYDQNAKDGYGFSASKLEFPGFDGIASEMKGVQIGSLRVPGVHDKGDSFPVLAAAKAGQRIEAQPRALALPVITPSGECDLAYTKLAELTREHDLEAFLYARDAEEARSLLREPTKEETTEEAVFGDGLALAVKAATQDDSEQAKLAGYRIGDSRVEQRTTGYLVPRTSAREVLRELASHACKSVMAPGWGVRLRIAQVEGSGWPVTTLTRIAKEWDGSKRVRGGGPENPRHPPCHNERACH